MGKLDMAGVCFVLILSTARCTFSLFIPVRYTDEAFHMETCCQEALVFPCSSNVQKTSS